MVQKQTLPGDEFTHELTEWEKKLQGASSAIPSTQQRLQDIERKIGSIQMRTSVAVGAGLGATEGAGMFAFRDLPKLEKEFKLLKEQKDLLIRELDRNIFSIDLYGTIPMLIESGAVSTPDDALANISLPQSLTEDEKNNIRTDISRLIATRDRVRAPLPDSQVGAELPPPPELPVLTVPRRTQPSPATIHRLSVTALIKSLQKPPPVTQFSEAEYNDYLRTYRGWSQEDIDRELQQRTVTLLADAQNRKNLINTFRTEGAKIPDQTFREVLSQAINQPALSTLEMLMGYYERVSMPNAGWLYGKAIPDITREQKRFRAANPDASDREAWAYAWKTWDAPGPPILEFIYKDMLMEGLVDPMSYIGVGLFAKGGRALGAFGRVGAKLGMGITAIDLAFMEVLDLPFDGIKWATGKIPKTIVQQGREASLDSQSFLIAFFERMTNESTTPFSKLKVKKMQELIKTTLDYFATHLREDNDVAQAAQRLLIHPPITKKDIGSYMTRLQRTGVGTYSVENLTDGNLIGINTLFERVLGKEITAIEAVPEFLQRLGVTFAQDATSETSDLAARILFDRVGKIYRGATDWITGATSSTRAMIMYARKADDVLTKVAEFNGMKSARAGGRFMLFSFNLDNRYMQPWMEKINRAIVRPFADSYLTFVTLGPFNVVEDIVRSALGGVKAGRMTVERNELITMGLRDDPSIRIGRLSETAGPLPDTGEFQRTQWVTALALSPVTAPMWAATSALEAAGVKGAGRLKVTPGQVGKKSFELMVSNFGEISQEIRRNFRNGKYMQLLADAGGDTFKQLYNTVGTVPVELKDAPKWVGRNLKKDLQSVATTGQFHSGNTQMIQSLKNRYTRNRVVMAEVDDLIKKNMMDTSGSARAFVFNSYRDGLMDTSETINEFMGRVLSMDREDFIRSPERGAAQSEQLRNILNDLEVTNPTDMSNLITSLHKMMSTYGILPDQIIAQATVHSRGLPLEKRLEFFDVELDRLYNYLDRAGASIDTIITKISQTAKGFNFVNNIDWGKVEFSNIPLETRAQIRTAIDKLPFSFKNRINRISIDFDRVAVYDEPGFKVDAFQGGNDGKEIVIRDLKTAQSEQTLFHELAHSYMRTSIDFGDTEVISEFARALGKPESFIESVRLRASTGFYDHYSNFAKIHEQFSEVFSEYASGIYRPLEVRAEEYKVASLADNKQLREFFQTYFPKTQRDLLLAPDKREAILKYTELSEATRKAITTAKEEDSIFRREYFSTATKQDMKSPGFWERFYGIEMSHWGRVAEDMAILNASLLSAVDSINATAGFKMRPRAPIRVIDRPLAPADVAALMRVRGTELSRMLLDSTIPEGDKRYFVKYVKSLVQTGDEGFTDDAIGAVYDQIANALEVDPSSSHLFRLRSMQIESMRRDLQDLWAGKLFPPEQKKVVDEYIESTAKKLDDVLYEKGEVARVLKPEFAGVARETPESISSVTGMKFEGMQEVPGGKPPLMVFSDPVTKSTLFASTLDEAMSRLIAMRKRFGAAAPVFKKAVSNYDQIRQSALDEANKWFYKEYTDYTHGNAVDSFFKNFYPFWTYETNRWFYLPRMFLRKPGTLTAWGRWENNTDTGYVHIPGTTIDVHPGRGFVIGPWSTRMMRRDFPEYYDQLEGMKGVVGFFDWVSRYGWYPNVIYGASLALFGGLETQLGSIMPPIFSTPLNALVAAAPKSEFVKFLSDRVFSEPFRNYLTARRVDDIGYDGSRFSAKLKIGEKLTEEEQQIWTDARGYTALHSAAFEQFGVFRMKSDQAHQLSRLSEQVTQEMWGFTPEQQRIMRLRGEKMWDVIGGLDPWEIAVMKELEFFKYAGSINAVLPSAQQTILNRIELDWADVEKYSENMKNEELLLMQDFLVGSERGRLGPRDFQNRVRDLYRKRREYVDRKTEKNPLMLLKNRTEIYEKNHTPMPVQSPYRELMSMFFEIEVKDAIDPATGERVLDWDKFWANKDMITDAIPPDDRGQWDAYLARHTTPLMQTWRTVYQTYFKKYHGLWDKVKESYSPDEQKLIDEYLYLERTGQQQERQLAIKELKSAKDGNQLISSFRSAVSDEREALRFANPHLDAWLYYWGDVKSFKTLQAEKVYRDIAARTGRKIDKD